MARMDAVHTQDLMDIRSDLTDIKEAVRFFTEWVDFSPPPQPPMPLLEVLTMDVDSLGLDFYDLSLENDNTNIEKLGGYLNPPK